MINVVGDSKYPSENRSYRKDRVVYVYVNI